MAIRPTNAQAISRVLRRNGFNPLSCGDSTRRWPALLCAKAHGEIRIRCWSNVEEETPNAGDREVIADIAELLKSKKYKIRYKAGDYYLYVVGKEA